MLHARPTWKASPLIALTAVLAVVVAGELYRAGLPAAATAAHAVAAVVLLAGLVGVPHRPWTAAAVMAAAFALQSLVEPSLDLIGAALAVLGASYLIGAHAGSWMRASTAIVVLIGGGALRMVLGEANAEDTIVGSVWALGAWGIGRSLHERLRAVGVPEQTDAARAEQPTPPTPEYARALDRLTPREREVVGLLAEGMSNAEIASRLHISESTAKTHVERILAKLEVRSRTEAAVLAARAGV